MAGPLALLPDLLTASRVLLGPLFVAVFPGAPVAGFVLAVVASLTDFVDGRLARRLGVGTPRGAVLDVVGDAVFVLAGTGALAWAGVISAALPIAAAFSLTALGLSWRRGAPGARVPRGWPDLLGHAAGVLNFGAVVVGSGFVAFEIPLPLHGASLLVAAANVAPIVLRRVMPARA